jgi:magnesium chelatase subunit D
LSEQPPATTGERTWQAALHAARLFATDTRANGLAVRALPGPVRDRFLAALRAMLPADAPLRRIPLHIGDDRLLGGLDLPATLQAGRPVASRGVLAEAHGGVVVLAMAERVPPATAARLCQSLDTGEVIAERDGMALRCEAAIGVVALDESVSAEERPAAPLMDRLAYHIDLTAVSLGEAAAVAAPSCNIQARADLPAITVPNQGLEALCATAAALGVHSTRALLLAVRAARAAAALAGRAEAAEADIATAAQLVLAPRATVLPAETPPAPANQSPADAGPTEPAETPPSEKDQFTNTGDGRDMTDIVLAAAKSAMPADLLARLLAGKAERQRPAAGAGAGATAQSKRRGRPVGVRAGMLGSGARLNLVETLRAAAPWQSLRRQTNPPGAPYRIIVMPDDFRVIRFRQRTETTTIFVVDASGSAALSRLNEAKGAVELVLADCYVRRDRVALIAFRGSTAELILPPTGSLLRAKRSLAGLPGGGGTPLAAGLDAAAALASTIKRQGQSAVVILLSDGRANVARDGATGRAHAEADAMQAGRLLREAAVPAVLVDTSPRAAPEARRLAAQMGARYLPLPYADAAALSRAVRAAPAG